MAPAYLKTPVPIRGSCLSNHTAVVAPSAPDYTPAWDTKIHVAFLDTRRSPRLYDIQMAAAVFNTSSVLLHVLLKHPRPAPGMRVTDVSQLPPLACFQPATINPCVAGANAARHHAPPRGRRCVEPGLLAAARARGSGRSMLP